MHTFAGDAAIIESVPARVTRTLATIDRGQGTEALHLAQMPGLLTQLATRARVLSVKASSALEGIVLPDDRRADRIIAGSATTLRSRDEFELAGYRDALDHLWQQDWRPLDMGLALHLHRLLLQHTPGIGGELKSADNVVVDRLSNGQQRVGFHPVSASRTPWALESLFDAYQHQRAVDHHHPVLLIGLTVLDFLVIHPFDDGNGRVARILTTALLQEADHRVGRYVSLEKVIAETSDEYYRTLLASTNGWHEGQHDPRPWLACFVTTVSRAYELFSQRAASAQSGGGGKRDRVKRYVLEQAPVTFSIADIRTALPGVSDGTIRNALDDLRGEGRIRSNGPGRSATWTRR